MAARRTAQPIAGIPLADLPDGETTFRISKDHRADYEPQGLSREDAARYPHRVCKFADGQFSYLGNSPAGPLQMEELASRYGPGLYQQTPIDPQTRQPIEALAFDSKILPPDPAPYQYAAAPVMPAIQPPSPPPVDLHMQMILDERARQERQSELIRAEQDRLRAEQREAAAEAKQREAEKFDKLLALAGTLLTGLPAALAALKTTIAPPPAPAAPPPPPSDPALTVILDDIRRQLQQKQPGRIEQLQEMLIVKSLTDALGSQPEKDSEEDDLDKFGKIVNNAAPVVTAVLDRVAPPRQDALPSPLSSPSALIAEIGRVGPDRAGEVLRQLGAQHPEVAQLVINSLQASAPKPQADSRPRLRRADDEAAA